MKLKLKIQRDGSLRPRWYGAWMTDGKSHETSLCRWRGTPPASFRVSDEGDKAFEDSRTRALAELREIIEGERSESDRASLAARAHRARYGHKIRRVKIAGLYEAWLGLQRKRMPTAGHDAVCRQVFERFEEYMRTNAPKVTETGALTPDHLRGFMDSEKARGVSARTWNGTLSILRGTLERVDPHSSGFIEYLRGLPMQDMATVHRRPFDEDEIARIFAAAEQDPFIFPLVVTAACTAMRRGDVARLRWADVDLEAGFITVKTSKTGETVDIPIFPQLRQVLESRKRRGAYVFPEAAKQYATTPQVLDNRLRSVFEAAGFIRPAIKASNDASYPPTSPDEIVTLAMTAMPEAGWGEKRQQTAMEILRRHLGGKSGLEIAAEMGISRGGVSTHLHSVEELIKRAVISTPQTDEPKGASMLAEIQPDVQRAKRGSLVGWHSFRTTWVTLALSRGVPLDLVRTVTGHRTAEIVMKYYYRPNRKQLRDAIGDRMPRALLGEADDPVREPLPEWAVAIVKTLTAKNADEVRAELLKGGAA